MKIRQKAFAAINIGDPKHILAWTVAAMAQTVRERVGRTWCEEDSKEGWRAARIEGMRVIKIEMVA